MGWQIGSTNRLRHSSTTGRMGCALLVILIFFVSSLPLLAFPPGFHEQPREHVFHIETSKVTSRATTAILSTDSELSHLSRLRFQLSQSQTDKPYVLRLRLGDASARAGISLNDQILPFPVKGDDGWYSLITPQFNRLGENLLTIQISSATKTYSIEEIEMASLEDTLEIVHFAQIFGSTATRVQPSAHPSQLQFDVLHYDLVLPLNMTETAFSSASLTMTARSLVGQLSQIALDLDDNDGRLVVSNVTDMFNDIPLTFDHSGDLNRIIINLNTPLTTGTTFSLRIQYGGVPDTNHNDYFSYVATTHAAEPIVQTFSQPYSARSWWPCKDIPEDKATFSAHITCPLGLTAISNGSLVQVTHPTSTTQTFHWNEAHPMATYLASVTCTNYEIITATYTSLDGLTTMPVAHCVYPENLPPNGTESLAGTLLYLRLLSEMFGEYPFIDEKYYNVVAEFPGGMEHQTCTMIYAGGLYNNGMSLINAHEIAHQWFGDYVTTEHYDHLWLNEGFATYCEALVTEKLSGRAAYHNLVNNWTTSDIEPIIGPSADKFRGTVVYRKAGFVLHMLRRVVGDEFFFQAIRNYLSDPRQADGTALTADLQRHFEELHGQPLDWFFDQWLTRASRPQYRWAWRLASGTNGPEAHIWVDQTQADAPYTMPMELALNYAGPHTEPKIIWIDRSPQTFKIPLTNSNIENINWDPENWVLDIEQWGSFPDTALWASDWNLDFGHAAPGKSNTRTLTLENLGKNALIVQSVWLEGDDITEFRISATALFPQTLLPLLESQIDVPIYFIPTRFSSAKTRLIIETDAGTHWVSLAGKGVSEWKDVAPAWIIR